MKILIAGGSGFIGRNVAHFLNQQSKELIIHGLSRKNPNIDCFSYYHCVDLKKPLHLPQDYDVIINASGKSTYDLSDEAMTDEHLLTNRNLLNFSKEKNIAKYILVSTSSVYLKNADVENAKEVDLPPSFFNSYARVKRLAELETLNLEADFKKIILRPRMVMGAGDTSWLPYLYNYANRGFYAEPSRDVFIQPTPIQLLGLTASHIINHQSMKTGIYNITGGKRLPYRDLLNQLNSASKNKNRIKLTFPGTLGKWILRSHLFHEKQLADLIFNMSCSLTLNCDKIASTGLDLNKFKIEDAIDEFLKTQN